MAALERSAKELVPDKVLYELVKMRASQLNGCAYCLDMHTIDARAEGETEQRIYLLSVWREAEALYTERERAALAWTEAMTLLTDAGAPDDVYEMVRKQFSEEELTNLTLLIIAINGWNRFGVGFRLQPGNYEPRTAQASTAQ
jgi:AhpD family alkylhydroperoxidase